MLYDKACAVVLLNRLKENNGLVIEDQYTKSDFIFYKFRGSNVAVTKKLNHIDFSILSEEELNYLLNNLNNEYINENSELIESTSIEYHLLIKKWSDEESIISKMYSFINNKELNDKSLVKIENSLIQNKAILELLMNSKLMLVRNNYYNIQTIGNGDLPVLDVDIEKRIIRNDRDNSESIKIEAIIKPTNNNINEVKNIIDQEMGTEEEENSCLVNKVNLLIGLLIVKYNANRDNRSFDSHRKNLYKIKSNNQIKDDPDNERFMKNYRNSLINLIYSPSSSLIQVLFGGYHYYSIWELRREIGGSAAELDIHYRSMSDEHLFMFRDFVNWLIARHAKYIGVHEKDIESYCMFLGSNILKGKKATKEVLTRHLNLANMDLEIQRREGER